MSLALCVHCNEPIVLANPSGFCNHVYYPEGCDVCNAPAIAKQRIEKAAPALLAAAEAALPWLELIESKGDDHADNALAVVYDSLRDAISQAKP